MIKGLLKRFSDEYLKDTSNYKDIEDLNVGYTLHMLRYVYEDTTKEKIYNNETLLKYLLENNFDIIFWGIYFIVKFENDEIVYVKGFDGRRSLKSKKEIEEWTKRREKR